MQVVAQPVEQAAQPARVIDEHQQEHRRIDVRPVRERREGGAQRRAHALAPTGVRQQLGVHRPESDCALDDQHGIAASRAQGAHGAVHEPFTLQHHDGLRPAEAHAFTRGQHDAGRPAHLSHGWRAGAPGPAPRDDSPLRERRARPTSGSP